MKPQKSAKNLPIMDSIYAHSRSLTARFEHAMIVSPLTPTQILIVDTLSRQPKRTASQIELVKLTGIDRSTMTACVGLLIQKGYLQMDRKEGDRRVVQITITAVGNDTLKAAMKIAHGAQDNILAGIAESRREGFLKLLRTATMTTDAVA